jgi:hypothetical protein
MGSGTLFEPNTLLPEQFAAALRQKAFVEGEKRLLAAILIDAVECYMKQYRATDRRGRHLFEEAEAWIFNDSRSEFLSFASVCEVLGIEPDYVRRGLLEWRRRKTQHQEAPRKAVGE